MAFEIELAFERLVYGLDGLAEGTQVVVARAGGLGFECWSDQGDAGVGEFGLEAGSPVALVGDEGLADGGELTEGDHVQRSVTFVGLGAGEGVGDREA